MTGYTSDEFYPAWRYAVDHEFTTPRGDPFSFATHGHKTWGDEIKKLSFDVKPGRPSWVEPHGASISSDGQRLAVAVANNIHIFDTGTWEVAKVLEGHTNRVGSFAFKPGDANTLVSADPYSSGILVWNLGNAEQSRHPGGADQIPMEGISAKAPRPIFGRLTQNDIFSPSGKWLAYLPKGYPSDRHKARPPGEPFVEEPWDIVICASTDFNNQVTLHGHTGLITWLGWSPDESLFGSVSWDGTIRIWDAASGQEKQKFVTNHQNWIGAFSPNAKYFAATSGSGMLHVYTLADGSTHWELLEKGKQRWKRALEWHPNGKWLAMGSENLLQLLDVEDKNVLQERTFSPSASLPDHEDVRDMITGFLEVVNIKFLENGKKLAFWTNGDDSTEIFDIEQEVKWRFGRGGTDDGPRADEWRDERGKVTSTRGTGMVVWEDEDKTRVSVASLDFDGIRIWSLE